ncbi:alpha/beta hydrolase [Frateuria hangzhouensis]|uniref:alpha/beta hydrolase n=1 Tax=Frateuria hangzhouensis TaxID=2995589 RepID=UPI002260E78D|nr:alpha/beta hydrolase fold domain-containing protein [Frateuria sp. STR12]MCX7514111.1 alpha/beta hydrolase fold domain-containing protein [Frateuria sp. STR12]
MTATSVAIPYSQFASSEARTFFPKMLAAGAKAPPLSAPIERSRGFYDRLNSDRAARMRKRYPVTIQHQTIAGVGADVLLPAQGVSAANRHRVLINLHGGAFLWGAGSGGLVEAIPIASLGRIRVITLDYRQGPEYRFPTASEDVEAVYRTLLETHRPGEIGIYGCSAGGILTGEAVARFIADKLPVPGAIGTFCGSLVTMAGDSAYVGPLLNGHGVPAASLDLAMLPYFAGVDASDPMVQPGLSPALLKQFPPTLLITGTRDMAMSSVVHSQALLAQAGVEAELHVWEGMWHSFFSDPELPESRQAYRTIVAFFERHLAPPQEEARP